MTNKLTDMKKVLIFSLLIASPCFLLNAQKPKVALKWSPLGLATGNIGISGEFSVTKRSSIDLKVGFPAERNYSTTFDDKDASFNVKTKSYFAGYRIYFSRKRMKGFYIEPFVKHVELSGSGSGHSTIENDDVVMNFTPYYKGTGGGIQLGTQFRIAKIIVLDLFLLGPELNSSHVNFKTVEVTHTLPWTSSQADDAEQNIRDFLDDIPVIGKKTTLTVDQNNRTIIADYKGLLPGIRFGLSIGVAF